MYPSSLIPTDFLSSKHYTCFRCWIRTGSGWNLPEIVSSRRKCFQERMALLVVALPSLSCRWNSCDLGNIQVPGSLEGVWARALVVKLLLRLNNRTTPLQQHRSEWHSAGSPSEEWDAQGFLFVSVLTPGQVMTNWDNRANWITAKSNFCLNTPRLFPRSRMGAPIISLDYILAEVSSLLGWMGTSAITWLCVICLFLRETTKFFLFCFLDMTIYTAVIEELPIYECMRVGTRTHMQIYTCLSWVINHCASLLLQASCTFCREEILAGRYMPGLREYLRRENRRKLKPEDGERALQNVIFWM